MDQKNENKSDRDDIFEGEKLGVKLADTTVRKLDPSYWTAGYITPGDVEQAAVTPGPVMFVDLGAVVKGQGPAVKVHHPGLQGQMLRVKGGSARGVGQGVQVRRIVGRPAIHRGRRRESR